MAYIGANQHSSDALPVVARWTAGRPAGGPQQTHYNSTEPSTAPDECVDRNPTGIASRVHSFIHSFSQQTIDYQKIMDTPHGRGLYSEATVA